MANILYIPFINPVKFVDEDETEDPAYRTKHFDDFLDNEITATKAWMAQKCYAQKWQTSDTIKIQLESNYSPINVSVMDTDDNVIATVTAQNKGTNKYEAGMYIFEVAISLAAIPEGYYYLKLTAGSPVQKTFISELMHIAVNHENTVLIEYKNSRYHADVIFETDIEFGFRVEGTIGAYKPGGKRSLYEDEKLNPTVLSSKPYRVFDLSIGGSFGIPEWVIDKLNWIWSCNNVSVDGKSFAMEDSGIELKAEENYPFRGVTIKVREGINRGSKIVQSEGNTDKKLLVVYNIESKIFGDIAASGANNTIPIKSVE